MDLKNFFNDYLPDTETILYSVPNGRRTLIKAIKFVSEADIPITVNMKSIRGTKHARIVPYNFQLCGRSMADLDELITLESGDKLSAWSGSDRAITCKISGVEEVL